MITTVIIDDEEISRKTLANLLEGYFPDISVVASAASVAQGIQAVKQYQPQLVFLDIAMPDGNGFDVLDKTSDVEFQVIFVTAFHNYALKAFEFSALHYLLKPVNIEDLEKALQRFKNKDAQTRLAERLEILRQGLMDSFHKIALPSNDSILFVELTDIVRCEASHNYTIIYLKNNGHVVMAKSLHNYEKLLEPFGFFRVHDKHLLNLRYVSKYIRGKGGIAVLEDDSEIEISVRKKDDFLKRIATVIK